MNVPSIAKKTFEELKNQSQFMEVVRSVLDQLKKIQAKTDKARYVHQVVDEYNKEIFAHPLVQKFSPCKLNCTGCCHTQVSVTEDEAELLAKHIENGTKINLDRLKIQMSAGNDSEAYFKLKYEDRQCVFLSDEGACNVYEDRPSVCRTNAVLGSADQCDTSVSVQKTLLVKTPFSDLAIYASFYHAKESGTLPYMLGKILKLKS